MPCTTTCGNDPHMRGACRGCRYYRMTWDPKLPYGCAAHGFKSDRNPAQVVYETSGLECLLFIPRENRQGHRNRSCN
jgi:hypothetical protein